jgi:hypothetical protein
VEKTTKTLIFLYNNKPIKKLNSPESIQQALLKKEIERRGLKIKE